MECLLQYLDEVDDLIGIIGLCAERIRSVLLLIVAAIIFLGATFGGVILALSEPRPALAIAATLSILLLYRRMTGPGLQYAG